MQAVVRLHNLITRSHLLPRTRRHCFLSDQRFVMPVDKELFKEVMPVLALRIPKQKCQEMMKKFRGYTLERPKLRCLVQDGQRDDTKLLLLNEKLTDLTGLSEELQTCVSAENLEQCSYEVTFDYSYLNSSQVLKKLLPANVEAPSSFECIGHIAHLNLREDQLPFKEIIGEVILDKHPHLKTVVNKTGNIETEYRVFPMEVIAGINSTETEVVQHGARFKLDFAKVYWNSRLETEHKRLVSLFAKDDVVADIMAGIGPFAVPAAQKGCMVYANDLNPDSVKYMERNVELNRIASKVHVFRMDGREFVRLLLATPGGPIMRVEQLRESPPGETSGTSHLPPVPSSYQPAPMGVFFQHAVMNLPASAVEFLDAFNGAFEPGVWRGRLPMVHVYTFKKGVETDNDIISKVEHYLGGKLDSQPIIHVVRDVAPTKLMLCVSFRVPEAVAFNGREAGGEGGPADNVSSRDNASCNEASTRLEDSVKRQKREP